MPAKNLKSNSSLDTTIWEQEWTVWARGWLSGADRTATAAETAETATTKVAAGGAGTAPREAAFAAAKLAIFDPPIRTIALVTAWTASAATAWAGVGSEGFRIDVQTIAREVLNE